LSDDEQSKEGETPPTEDPVDGEDENVVLAGGEWLDAARLVEHSPSAALGDTSRCSNNRSGAPSPTTT
jgi:hypothetical protein